MMGLYVAMIAAVVVVCLYLVLRARSLAASVRTLAEQVVALTARMEDAERRSKASREAANAELEARTTAKMDKTAVELRDLILTHRAEMDAAIRELGLRISKAGTEPARPRARIVEEAAPAPALAGRGAQAEPPAVYLTSEGALPDSVEAPTAESLRRLKSELQLGISRIERAETLLLKREGDERAVIGAAGEVAPPDELSAEEAEFEDWEQEAKDLAEGDDAEEAVTAAAVSFREPPTEYPGEMGETGEEVPTELLEAGLYEDDEEDDVELPEIEDEEEPQAQ